MWYLSQNIIMDKQLLKEICERKPQQFRMKVSFFMNVQNISPSSVYLYWISQYGQSQSEWNWKNCGKYYNSSIKEAQNLHQLKSPFQTKNCIVKESLNVSILQLDLHHEIFRKEGLKGDISINADTGPLRRTYFDALVVFVMIFTLLFRLALAILWYHKLIENIFSF